MIARKSIYLEGVKKIKVRKKSIKIKNDELLVKVESCGVCSSDIKFIFNGSRIKKYPIILGHEISGQINKNKFVVFGAEIPCKNCQTCREQKNYSNLCNNPVSVGSNYDGGFSNYFILKKKFLKKIPHVFYRAKKSLKYASLSESLACVINGLEITNFKKNKSIAIIGSGYMGLLFVALAKLRKAKFISVIDFNNKRLKIAKSLGANHLFKLSIKNKKIIDKILKPTENFGYDAVISATSSLKAHELSCKLVGKNGTVNLFGGIPQKNKEIRIDSNFIHYKEAKITGSFSSNQIHLNKAFKIIKNKSIDFSKIVTSYSNFRNFKNKVNLLKQGKEIKSIFRPI